MDVPRTQPQGNSECRISKEWRSSNPKVGAQTECFVISHLSLGIRRYGALGIWGLRFGICLEFGVWSFGFSGLWRLQISSFFGHSSFVIRHFFLALLPLCRCPTRSPRCYTASTRRTKFFFW